MQFQAFSRFLNTLQKVGYNWPWYFLLLFPQPRKGTHLLNRRVFSGRMLQVPATETFNCISQRMMAQMIARKRLGPRPRHFRTLALRVPPALGRAVHALETSVWKCLESVKF